MNKVWITSDSHFSHENIIQYELRPFQNSSEMNETLISNWNELIGENDCVYHLGDFSLGRANELRNIVQALNGNIILIAGNHDGFTRTQYLKAGIVCVVNELFIHTQGLKCRLSHEPEPCSLDPNSVNLHGHVHGKKQFSYKHIHVGVDAWEYKPLDFDDLILTYRKTRHKYELQS